MSLCVRARVANTKVISPCSFFLSVSGGGGPGGVGGRPGRRLRGRAGAEAWSGLWEGSSESLFHIPGVRAREKTVGSTASMSRCRLRERVAPWPGTSVQEAGQAGRGRGAEGRLPALEWWGRGRGAASSPGHCAPADFHGRLPRSRGRRPGAGHSLGFKRHSRNVNNPGGRASGRERARTAGLGPPHPPPGTADRRGYSALPSTCRKLFLSLVLQFHLVPPARSRAKGLSHSLGSRSLASRTRPGSPGSPGGQISASMPRARSASAPVAAATWAGGAKRNWGSEPALPNGLLAFSRPPSRGSFPRSPPSPFP